MYGYTKARRAKRLMRLFIEKGWLEEAALIGLLYQTPIRIREALQLKKSDIEGREIAVSGECYAEQNGKPYRITRQLRNLIDSVNKNSDTIFTKKMNSYVLKCNRYDRTLRLHELRREYIVRHVLLQKAWAADIGCPNCVDEPEKTN